ncbi:MAG: EF-P lysine aminoacylase GenX [Geobacteraceae bacterium]|nr:EF-P lysine aminoacylase GenX [Geobacteraceae bacterium]
MNSRLYGKSQRLTIRAQAVQNIRMFFINRGYLEVDTPLLIPAPAPEAHIDAIPAAGLYLQTSPELCMKRLLAAGYRQIFQISKCWRAAERGSRHLPEFTMLEWYAADRDYRYLMTESMQLISYLTALHTADRHISYNGTRVDLCGEFEQITVREAFKLYAGCEMEEALAKDEFDELMTEKIEPRLGNRVPTIIYDYPASRAALSRLRSDDPTVAERFELYIAGVELANAFSELNDNRVQRKRFEEELELRKERGAPFYPLPEPFLAEIATMPPAAGIALGVDRLIMLISGAATIDEVVAFTPEEL